MNSHQEYFHDRHFICMISFHSDNFGGRCFCTNFTNEETRLKELKFLSKGNLAAE